MKMELVHRYPSELNKAFKALEKLLIGMNYAVFLRHYFDENSSLNTPFVDTLRAVLPEKKIVIGGSATYSSKEVILEFKQSLLYVGDDTSDCGCPYPGKLSSNEFTLEFNAALSELKKICDSCETIEGVYIKEGHPAYPVFWNFEWLFRSENGCHIIIGSSSD